METIYRTQEWKGYGKQNYYWNEYRQEGDVVTEYKCNRCRSFDGSENNWDHDEREIDSWNINDPSMPDWLHKHVK